MSEQKAEKARAICVGEALIELARGADGRFALSCGGDTFNTAIYLARAGVDVAFATALGDDPYSESMTALAAAERVSCNLVLRVAGRLPGLVPCREWSVRRTRRSHLARGRPGARAFRASRLDARRRKPGVGPADLFFRHHAVALFEQRPRPLPRRARSRAPAGRQGGVRRQFPPPRLERRPRAHAHRFHRDAQARRYRAADLR